MKIILTMYEVNALLVDHLISKEKLNNENTKVTWHIDKSDDNECYISFEQ